MSANRCTCQSGRDTDGSEFGRCEWCEDADAREHDETFAEAPSMTLQEALLLDAEILRAQGVDVVDPEFFE